MTLRATICAKAEGRVGYWRFCPGIEAHSSSLF
jgi:hypothetical protein